MSTEGAVILLFGLIAFILYAVNRLAIQEISLEKWVWHVWQALPFLIVGFLAIYVFVVGGIPEIKSLVENTDQPLFFTILATALILLPVFYLITPLIRRLVDWYLSEQENIEEREPIHRKSPTPSTPDEEAASWHLSYLRGAMRRVNVDLFQSDFMLDDLGLLVYRDAEDKNPELIRVQPIPKKARFLRPFVALEPWQQWQNPKAAPLVLEICEENSNVLYRYEGILDWKDSDTALLLPTTWLDVSNAEQDLGDNNWSIRVHVNGKLLALHLVHWSKFDEEDIAKERHRDGEISPKLRRLMEQERASTNISLDDLLAEQTIGEN